MPVLVHMFHIIYLLIITFGLRSHRENIFHRKTIKLSLVHYYSINTNTLTNFKQGILIFNNLETEELENLVGKGEKAGYQQFLLFPQSFLLFPKVFQIFSPIYFLI